MNFLSAGVSRRFVLEGLAGTAAAALIPGCTEAPSDIAVPTITTVPKPTKLTSPQSLEVLPGGFAGPVHVDSYSGQERVLAAITPMLGGSENTGNSLYRVPVSGDFDKEDVSEPLNDAANINDPFSLKSSGEVVLGNNGFYFRVSISDPGRFIPYPYGFNEGIGVLETPGGIWITTANLKDPTDPTLGYNKAQVLYYKFDASGTDILDDNEPKKFDLKGHNATSIGKMENGRLVILTAGDSYNPDSKPYLNILHPETGELENFIDLKKALGIDFVGQFSGHLAVGVDKDAKEFVALGTTRSSKNENAYLIKVYLDDLDDLVTAQLFLTEQNTVTGVVLVGGALLVAGLYEAGALIPVLADTFVQSSNMIVLANADQRLGRIAASESGVVAVVNGRSSGTSELVFVGVE